MIAFIEKEYTIGDPRYEFHKLIEKNNHIKLFHAYEEEILDANVLFIHDSCRQILYKADPDINSTKPMTLQNDALKDKYKIFYGGGNGTIKKNIDDKTISYISVSDLKERLDEIINSIKNLQEVSKESLEEIIFAIDPELERLLEPFQNAMPFKEYWNEYYKNGEKIDLNTQKEELLSHIKIIE